MAQPQGGGAQGALSAGGSWDPGPPHPAGPPDLPRGKMPPPRAPHSAGTQEASPPFCPGQGIYSGKTNSGFKYLQACLNFYGWYHVWMSVWTIGRLSPTSVGINHPPLGKTIGQYPLKLNTDLPTIQPFHPGVDT